MKGSQPFFLTQLLGFQVILQTGSENSPVSFPLGEIDSPVLDCDLC